MHSVRLPRTCLGVTNFIFFMLGLVGGAICIWCAYNTKFFKDVNYTITKSPYVATIADFVNLNLLLIPMSSIFIPIAAMTMLTSCCGILGAGCKIKCAIKSYIFFVTIIYGGAFWIFFISGVYNIYTNNERTKVYLQSSLQDNYGKENDFFTFVWNYIMVEHECCGVVCYTDFANSNWRKTNIEKLYPVECCVLANKTALLPASPKCTQSLDTNIQSYKDVGCMLALRESIIRNKPSLIFYIVLLCLLYFIIILFAYCILRGEPLLAPKERSISDSISAQPQQHLNTGAPSITSLENMMFVEEPPKKVMRVVSAVNPFQTYKFTPISDAHQSGTYTVFADYKASNVM